MKERRVKSKAVSFELVLACLAAAGCSASASPNAPPVSATQSPSSAQPTPAAARSGVIRFVDLDNFDVRDMPMRMALDALAEQGYEIETLFVESSSLIAETLARAHADIAWSSNLSVWTAVAEGLEARTLMETAGSTTSSAPAFATMVGRLKETF